MYGARQMPCTNHLVKFLDTLAAVGGGMLVRTHYVAARSVLQERAALPQRLGHGASAEVRVHLHAAVEVVLRAGYSVHLLRVLTGKDKERARGEKSEE